MGGGGGGGGGVTAGLAGAVLAVEVCAPILLLCGLCCWPDDNSDKSSSSGKRPQKPVVAREASTRRRRSSDLFSRRGATSALSLHLPSTSGTCTPKQALSSHRSHEHIPPRRAALPPPDDDPSRYHSAPSVIDEVLHRRDWERSTKELYIPLRPPGADPDPDSDASSDATNQPDAPGYSAECLTVPCKKHYTNIKSSKNRKESRQDDVKDKDATEDISNSCSNFYIGDIRDDASILSKDNTSLVPETLGPDNFETPGWEDDGRVTSGYTAKEAKQTFNESIKSKRPAEEFEGSASGQFIIHAVDLDLDELSCGPEYGSEWDRSGATRHTAGGSYTSLETPDSRTTPYITPLQESRPWLFSLSPERRGGAGRGGRHCSDGDILARAHRPESGAFSESDVETGSTPLPRPHPRDVPTTHKLQPLADRKETAI